MKERNLTEGPILQKMVLFSLPMIAGNLLQQFYNLADTLIVGRFIGSDALASVGSSYTLMTFLNSVIIGLCMGSGACFSEDYGGKNGKQLKEDILHSFLFIFSVTILICILIYPLADVILHALRIPSKLYAMTRSYTLIVFSGILFVFFYNFNAYLFRSMGNSSTPLVWLAVSSLLNIVLDILFVTEFQMGVQGVALATVISQALSGIGITVHAFLRLNILHLQKTDLKWNSTRMKQIIISDCSTGIQQSVMNFGILMIQGLVNSFGLVIMAAFAAVVKIDTIAYMPAQEFGNAYSLFISQNYGADKQDRIRKGTAIAFRLSSLFCLSVSVLIFLYAGNLMKIFVSSSNTDIISAGISYLRIEGSMYIGIGILFLWYGYFRAIDLPQISLLLTIISLGTRVFLSYALSPVFNVTIIWISIPIGWFLADLVGFCLFHRKSV